MSLESDEAWEAHKAKRAKEAERAEARRDPWFSLPIEERRRRSKLAVKARLKRERARQHLRVCAMPLCNGDAINTLAGKGLGICLSCSFDILNHFKELDEMPALTQAAADREVKRIVLEQREQAAAESRRITPGWIYYIEVADRIKIGYTTDLKRRLKQYPPDTPLLAMHPGTKQLESDMHAKFAGSKAAGREWFLDTPELRQHIREVIAQFGEPDRARYEHRGKMRSGLRAAPPKSNGLSI